MLMMNHCMASRLDLSIVFTWYSVSQTENHLTAKTFWMLYLVSRARA